jgi:parallel beta-helix repeat protein
MLPLAAQERGRRVPNDGVIASSGTYFLDRDVAFRTGGPAILVRASDVTLDLNGYHVMGPGGKMEMGVVIRNATNVKVHNGSISNFAFGIVVDNSAGVILQDLRIRAEGLPILALPPEVGIMIVQSRAVTVVHNSIYNTGLGIFVRGSRSWGNRLAHNTVTAGMNGALGICYNPADGDPSAPRGDVVENNLISGFGTGVQLVATSAANIVRNNNIAFRMMAIENLGTTNVIGENTSARLP